MVILEKPGFLFRRNECRESALEIWNPENLFNQLERGQGWG
jgi:hypothetical protein